MIKLAFAFSVLAVPAVAQDYPGKDRADCAFALAATYEAQAAAVAAIESAMALIPDQDETLWSQARAAIESLNAFAEQFKEAC